MSNEKIEIGWIHDKVIELWREYRNHAITERVPMFYPENLKKGALLFIGLNPSFSVDALRKILRDTEYQKILDGLDDYFSFENFKNEKIVIFQRIAEISREKQKYFSKFKGLAKTIGCEWEHIDLLFIRHINQKEVEKLFKPNGGYIKFVSEQIKLTVKLIYSLAPKIVVIENAFVSKIVKNKLRLEWDDGIGTYRLDKTIPVFLAGMLTGQRAMDLGSYERLKWHIRFVAKKT